MGQWKRNGRIDHMFAMQRPDGGFDWLDFGLEPFEANNEVWGRVTGGSHDRTLTLVRPSAPAKSSCFGGFFAVSAGAKSSLHAKNDDCYGLRITFRGF